MSSSKMVPTVVKVVTESGGNALGDSSNPVIVKDTALDASRETEGTINQVFVNDMNGTEVLISILKQLININFHLESMTDINLEKKDAEG